MKCSRSTDFVNVTCDHLCRVKGKRYLSRPPQYGSMLRPDKVKVNITHQMTVDPFVTQYNKRTRVGNYFLIAAVNMSMWCSVEFLWWFMLSQLCSRDAAVFVILSVFSNRIAGWRLPRVWSLWGWWGGDLRTFFWSLGDALSTPCSQTAIKHGPSLEKASWKKWRFAEFAYFLNLSFRRESIHCCLCVKKMWLWTGLWVSWTTFL